MLKLDSDGGLPLTVKKVEAAPDETFIFKNE